MTSHTILCQKQVSRTWISNDIPHYSVGCHYLSMSLTPAAVTQAIFEDLLEINKYLGQGCAITSHRTLRDVIIYPYSRFQLVTQVIISRRAISGSYSQQKIKYTGRCIDCMCASKRKAAKLHFLINTLWSCDLIGWHWSRLTVAHAMVCCLRAQSHYLNQCWLLIGQVLWHSHECNFTAGPQAIILYNSFPLRITPF